MELILRKESACGMFGLVKVFLFGGWGRLYD